MAGTHWAETATYATGHSFVAHGNCSLAQARVVRRNIPLYKDIRPAIGGTDFVHRDSSIEAQQRRKLSRSVQRSPKYVRSMSQHHAFVSTSSDAVQAKFVW